VTKPGNTFQYPCIRTCHRQCVFLIHNTYIHNLDMVGMTDRYRAKLIKRSAISPTRSLSPLSLPHAGRYETYSPSPALSVSHCGQLPTRSQCLHLSLGPPCLSQTVCSSTVVSQPIAGPEPTSNVINVVNVRRIQTTHHSSDTIVSITYFDKLTC
jgi:hypothetical protein